MLTFSPGVMTALETNAEQRRKDRFLAWIASLNKEIGPISREQAGFCFDATLKEAEKADIDTDERLFDYVLARLLMPDMNGMQYMQALDAVFSDLAPAQRVQAMLEIRNGSHG